MCDVGWVGVFPCDEWAEGWVGEPCVEDGCGGEAEGEVGAEGGFAEGWGGREEVEEVVD